MSLAETFASLPKKLQEEVVLQWFGNQMFMVVNFDEKNAVERESRLRDIAALRAHPLHLALPAEKQTANVKLFDMAERLIKGADRQSPEAS